MQNLLDVMCTLEGLDTILAELHKPFHKVHWPQLHKSDLLDEVTLKSDVFDGFMGQRYRRDVGHPLCLVDDGVGEVQDLPVLHLHLAVPNHSAQLLLDLGWDKFQIQIFWTIWASTQKRGSSDAGE